MISLNVSLPSGALVPRARLEQAPLMIEVYGLGYAAVFLVFALLYCMPIGGARPSP